MGKAGGLGGSGILKLLGIENNLMEKWRRRTIMEQYKKGKELRIPIFIAIGKEIGRAHV